MTINSMLSLHYTYFFNINIFFSSLMYVVIYLFCSNNIIYRYHLFISLLTTYFFLKMDNNNDNHASMEGDPKNTRINVLSVSDTVISTIYQIFFLLVYLLFASIFFLICLLIVPKIYSNTSVIHMMISSSKKGSSSTTHCQLDKVLTTSL